MIGIKNLTCCCCGEGTKGKQWWKRDKGFGLCASCAERISKVESAESMEYCYGKEGTNYNVKEVEE